MDIAQISMTMSRTKLLDTVAASLLSKQLDVTEQLGEGMIKMMEQSVNPELGQNVDIRL